MASLYRCPLAEMLVGFQEFQVKRLVAGSFELVGNSWCLIFACGTLWRLGINVMQQDDTQN